jgi:hypothetical protein
LSNIPYQRLKKKIEEEFSAKVIKEFQSDQDIYQTISLKEAHKCVVDQ